MPRFRAALERELRIEQVVQETDDGAVYLARDLTLDRRVLVRALDSGVGGARRGRPSSRASCQGARVAQRPAYPGGALRRTWTATFVSSCWSIRRAIRSSSGSGRDRSHRTRSTAGRSGAATLEAAHAAGIVHAAVTPPQRGPRRRAVPAGWIRQLSRRDRRRPGRSRGGGRLLKEAAGGALPRPVRAAWREDCAPTRPAGTQCRPPFARRWRR